LHSTEPWVLSSLYTGQVVITNYVTNSVVKSFDVSETYPVRAARFVERKQWIVCGSDDMMIRVYNYNTLDKEKQFEAHQDYIRSIAVHPSQPLILTSSDDLTIKLWNWEKWECVRTFESHTHYVMHVCFNPKDPSTFASASLDHTIKVWSINSNTPNYTLEGHEKGVNYVDYYQGNDKPYLISGSDDK
jgi:coatomer subunit beta'